MHRCERPLFRTLLLICFIAVTLMGYLVATGKHDTVLKRTEFKFSLPSPLVFLPTVSNSSQDSKLLCFVLSNNAEKMKAVYTTWGQRCDKLLFIVGKEANIQQHANVVQLNVREGRDHLTAKTRQAIMYIYEHFLDSFDWFMKADDDTFVIVENLKFLLSKHSPNESVKLGHYFKFHHKSGQGYSSGGAGYVMSRAALRAVVEEGFKVKGRCREDGGPEDINTADCQTDTGAKQYSSRDTIGRESFLPMPLQNFVVGPLWWDHKRWSVYPQTTGPECCSSHLISFHKINHVQMYIYYHLLYRTKVWGETLNEQTPVFVKKKEPDIPPNK